MKSSAKGIKLNSFDDLFGVNKEEESTEGFQMIPLDHLCDFKDHPFLVTNDDKMNDLMNSISENGVLNPIIVRPAAPDQYEIISGHRRTFASRKLGLENIPAIIKEDLTDEEATILMVDANIQREELLPSEKAFAYKMKIDAFNHQGKKGGMTTRDLIGDNSGVSGRQIQRYIRLTYLITDLLLFVNDKKINLNTGYHLSYLSEEEQEWVVEYVHKGTKIKEAQAQSLKALHDSNQLTKEKVENVLLKGKIKPKHSLQIKRGIIDHFFPEDYTTSQCVDVIVSLLEEWKDKKRDGD